MSFFDFLKKSILSLMYPDPVFLGIKKERVGLLFILVLSTIYPSIHIFLHDFFLHDKLPGEDLFLVYLVGFLGFFGAWLWLVLVFYLMGRIYGKNASFRRLGVAISYTSVFFPLMPFIDFLFHYILQLPVLRLPLIGCGHASLLFMVPVLYRSFVSIFKHVVHVPEHALLTTPVLSAALFALGKILFANLYRPWFGLSYWESKFITLAIFVVSGSLLVGYFGRKEKSLWSL